MSKPWQGQADDIRPLDHVGVMVTIWREIVRQKVSHTSMIWCEWTDGVRGCCEVWRHDSDRGITIREALDKASAEGWLLVGGHPVCPCHDDGEGGEDSDLKRMQKYLSQKGEKDLGRENEDKGGQGASGGD